MPGEAAAAEGRVGLREMAAMVGEFRRRLVLVPLRGGGWVSAGFGGLRWFYAFTSREALAVFARGRGEGGEWEFQSLYGARLVDEVIPSLDFWCGVAVDVGGEGGVLLPPVRGIVPERAAVDAAAEAARSAPSTVAAAEAVRPAAPTAVCGTSVTGPGVPVAASVRGEGSKR